EIQFTAPQHSALADRVQITTYNKRNTTESSRMPLCANLVLAHRTKSIDSSPVGEQKQSATFAPSFPPHLFPGIVRLDHDRCRHPRVQRAEIFVGAGLTEGEGEAAIGVERLRFK